MYGFSLPRIGQHLIHETLQSTLTVLGWALAGVVITALGGFTARRANDSRTRLLLGITLTLIGVVVVGSAVLYHNSIIQAVAPL